MTKKELIRNLKYTMEKHKNDKEMQEFYKGEHEKLERIEQIVKDYNNGSDMEYVYLAKIREVLEQE